MAAPPAPAKRLLAFIMGREAPHGYDTVYGNHQSKMPKPVTQSTVNDLITGGNWRAQHFGSSACGGYQFMSYTLANLKKTLGLTGNEIMTPAFQDELAYKLLRDRGYDRYMAGGLSVAQFGLALAKEWASFPVLADCQGQKRRVSRGQSYYAGDGINKSLVSPVAVESVLRSLRGAPAAFDATLASAIDKVEAPDLPRVKVVQGPPVTHPSLLGRLFGKKVGEHLRPGLRSSGDPKLWDVQFELKKRGYYTKGFLEGLDGPLTQEAVAQARKDNGLGDGGVDADFLEALPTFPQRPVSQERATLSIAKAAAARPDLFNPVKLLGGAGAVLSLGGAADGSGLLDMIQASTSKINDVAGSVQSVFAVGASILAFVVEHRSLFLVAIGLFLLWKAATIALDFWIRIRAAFL